MLLALADNPLSLPRRWRGLKGIGCEGKEREKELKESKEPLDFWH
jgi:hypothetical protein